MGTGLVLLSITIDPQYDTVEVLAEYARIWRANAEGWRMLTGSREHIGEVASRFGLVYWPEEGAITHTSTTGVIARNGRLAALIEGSSYDPMQLGDLIASLWEEK
jgi:protein SCO1/2